MKITFNTLLLFFLPVSFCLAQSFADETNKFRDHYKNEFLTTGNSPLKKEDLAYLRFYEPDSTFKVEARFEKVKGQPFEMPTYSGINKTYVRYGILKFRVNGKRQTLTVYRSLSLQANAKYKDYLFVPFKDKTNGIESYGGGRYIDLKTTDIKDDTYVLDFNKAYNPYCAYSIGFNCPIPPSANHLSVAIYAGEKKFAKEHEEASLK
ncbi:DUF1684 domain-containing protein [Dyadobacter aurulentus]|uniref:DUF1684 domain-containing protein n=1 Tax=Dyadobacter sp. UC 10 TaxID=2605428 RepID=UPI0011F3FAB5|nr:DUF1684 domain-containing protein [Dyadobacter sp. UC 10]KAA0988989.1 DUF1684 domain-containing protein [Dyadobacter sp. UC 10]